MSSPWCLAVSWMTTFLSTSNKYGGVDHERLELLRDRLKEPERLTALKATELKKLGMKLDRLIEPHRQDSSSYRTDMNYNCIHLKRPDWNAKKAEWLEYVHQCFFADLCDNIPRCHASTHFIWRILKDHLQVMQHSQNEENRTRCETALSFPSQLTTHYAPYSAYLQNTAITAQHMMGIGINTKPSISSNCNNSIIFPTWMHSPNTQLYTSHSLTHSNVNSSLTTNSLQRKRKPTESTQVTSQDYECIFSLDSCEICGCLGADTQLKPCGHSFHRWCLQQCCKYNMCNNQLNIQTCPVDCKPVQSTNLKYPNSYGNHDCKKVASTRSILSLRNHENGSKIHSPSKAQINETHTVDNSTVDLISNPNGIMPETIQKIYKQTQTGPFTSKLASIIAKEKTSKVKIKVERGYPINSKWPVTDTNSDTTHSQTARDSLEEEKVSLLRQMGFTDLQEMLTGLRHVESSSSEGDSENSPTIMDSETHAQMAMLWIVSQREEVDEARRIDEVRMRSEVIVIDDETNRNDPSYITKNFSSETILGQDNGVSKSSELFPSSVILESSVIRTLFRSMLLHDNSSIAVVRLLMLEKKIRQWFGSKIPKAYFHHIVCDKIEGWQREISETMTTNKYHRLTDLLIGEIAILENAVYNLSQQEKGDLGMMVPKVFLRAREKFAEESVSNRDEEIVLLDDDEIE